MDKWEEQGKVLKKDSGEKFSDTVHVGIVISMMPESIQEFEYSSLGIAVEYDAIFAKIRGFVSNKVSMAHGPTPMDVDKVSVDHAKVQKEYSEDDHEIDVVNMSIQCHGCGGRGHYKSNCPTAWAVVQEQHQVGNNGSKNSAKGIGGFGKGGKGEGVFPCKCFKCEAGHRKQDCTKVGTIDDDTPLSYWPTCHVESVWDIGNVDVDGG